MPPLLLSPLFSPYTQKGFFGQIFFHCQKRRKRVFFVDSFDQREAKHQRFDELLAKKTAVFPLVSSMHLTAYRHVNFPRNNQTLANPTMRRERKRKKGKARKSKWLFRDQGGKGRRKEKGSD